MPQPHDDPHPWDPGEQGFRSSVLAINFLADAGKLMLESSTSVSEVENRLRSFLPSVGLEHCSLDATMSSLIVSYWQPGQAMPLTTMREVHVASPRLERLAGTDALLDEVQSGSCNLEDAVRRLRELEAAPAPDWRVTHIALLASVLGWVVFVDGLDLVTIVVALASMSLTFPIGTIVERLRLPSLTTTFLMATVVAAIPNLLAAAGVHVLVGPAVVGALFISLPGRALVSSVIDGLANAPLSSISRAIQALATAGFLALGMLVGSKIGAGLGLNYKPNLSATPVAQSVVGSGIGVLGLAVAWAMPRRQIPPTLAISVAAWLIVAISTARLADQSQWPTYAIAAAVVGILGAIASSVQGSSASVYTGVAILPLVPGFTLYTGMLALAQGDTAGATTALADAAVVSLAIAIGVALGFGVGHNGVAVTRRVARRPTS